MADYDVYCLARTNGPGKERGLVIAVVPAGQPVCKPDGRMADPARFRKFTVRGLDAPEQLLQLNIREGERGERECDLYLRSRFKVDLAKVPHGAVLPASEVLAAATDRLPAARLTVLLGGKVRG